MRCPLDDVIQLSRVRGAVLANIHACEPWGLLVPSVEGASLHAVTAGTCWLRRDGDPAIALTSGDVVLLPAGAAHILASSDDEPALPFEAITDKDQRLSPEGGLRLGGDGAATRFICASYEYDHEVAHPLLSLLPAVLHIQAGADSDGAIPAVLRLLHLELDKAAPGTSTAVARLIDLLFVHVLRTWAAAVDERDASWLRALRDPSVAQALSLLHARPAEPWTIEALAVEVHLSRATLARRFRELVGEPPAAYLGRWRMELAARLLRETGQSLVEVAHQVGYRSEFAFSRAFTRTRGTAPSRYRASSRT